MRVICNHCLQPRDRRGKSEHVSWKVPLPKVKKLGNIDHILSNNGRGTFQCVQLLRNYVVKKSHIHPKWCCEGWICIVFAFAFIIYWLFDSVWEELHTFYQTPDNWFCKCYYIGAYFCTISEIWDLSEETKKSPGLLKIQLQNNYSLSACLKCLSVFCCYLKNWLLICRFTQLIFYLHMYLWNGVTENFTSGFVLLLKVGKAKTTNSDTQVTEIRGNYRLCAWLEHILAWNTIELPLMVRNKRN